MLTAVPDHCQLPRLPDRFIRSSLFLLWLWTGFRGIGCWRQHWVQHHRHRFQPSPGVEAGCAADLQICQQRRNEPEHELRSAQF